MANGSEATDNISFHLNTLPSTGARQREPQEQDPQILSASPNNNYIRQLRCGDTAEFKLTYWVFKGPARIIWRFVGDNKWGNLGYFKGKSYKRNFEFAFIISNVHAGHSGRYIVEILDKKRDKRCGSNPITIEWNVKVI
ncbi:uncharacterized protein [Asterias amurensis]|uniref:uncharacterized protein n=1 Tax=Asterias amurensis TaxID=7602 RepID=UPI003AB1798A